MTTVMFYKNLKRFGSIPLVEKQLFTEALLYLFAAKLLLSVLPFRHCVWLLLNKESCNENQTIEQLKQIKKAIHRTHWLSFWENECLVKSFASRWMLQRRNITSSVSLGATFDEDKKLIAHAWISVNEFEVVEKGGFYYVLYKF